MAPNHLDRLDEAADALRNDEECGYAPLSTGEKIYVALAANKPELLKPLGYTITGALDRLGPEDTAALIARWHFRG